MKKNRRRRKHILNILLTFWITFAGVLILGTAAAMIYSTMKAKEETALASSAGSPDTVSRLYKETIPEETEEAYRAAEEQQEGKYADILSDTSYMQKNNIYEKETLIENEVSLVFAGDILLDPGYSVMARMLQRAGGIYDSISEDLMEEMHKADIFMLNNEFPYSDRGMPTAGKQFTFRAKPESVSILKEMGADIVSLANNHAYDYGETAFLDTLDILKNEGIPYAGAGRNLEEASAPVYFVAGDIKIAFVSATQIEKLDNPDTKGAGSEPGVFRCWNADKLLETVKEAERNSDFVVVYIHWGTENTAEPDWAQLDQAPAIAEAGADLIIGNHSHCLQPIQYVNGVPVVYSLGNFLFNSKEVDTCLIKAAVDEKGLKSLQFVPAMQKDCAVSLLHGVERERVLGYMRSISPGIIIDDEGYIVIKR